MKTLVIAEHDNKTLKLSTLNTVTAASQLSTETVILVAGLACETVAQEASKINGLKTVIHADNSAYEHHTAENMAALIAELAKDYDAVLAPATTWGKNILPRVAALLNVGQISDITSIVDNNTFVRPIYAGNAFATIESHDQKKIITVRTTAFDAAKCGEASVDIIVCNSVHETGLATFVSQELTKSERPELTAARVVVSGGRALQNTENFAMLEELADCLNAAVGASRAAVDAGYVPNDYQVGQTGKIVAPELYIAIGISGAIQHLAGMKDSKVIVAINKDEDAPIFQVADYGLVGDLFDIVPKLIALLK